MASITPPKDGLVRAVLPGLEVRAAGDGANMPTLHGYFLRFNEWTEIDSLFEGRFMERIAPGAAEKTLRQRGDDIKILFNHGRDPQIGEKALTKPSLREDDEGVHYEGELFDTSYNRDLIPGLEAGQYGASFKFRVIAEEINEEPERSDENPDGIPERTITEIKLYEGGPVTFPAYEGATAGLRSRSLTDEFIGGGLEAEIERWLERNPERAQVLLKRLTDADKDLEVETDDRSGTTDEKQPAPPTEVTEDPPHQTGQSRAADVPLFGTTKNEESPFWRL